MKRLFLIAIVTVLTAIVGHTASDVVVDGVTYQWSNTDGAYIVTGWDEETPIQSLHIRSVVNDLDVIAIDDAAFEDNEDIVYLTIDKGIAYIEENAFCRCSNLKVAVLPEGLEEIGEEAFAFCASLKMMVIPSTVTDIHAHAFSGCTGVTDVYFLMTEASQLSGFDWWDGVYTSPGEEEHGGMEFNTNEHTVIHVPDGMQQDYIDSHKFTAWIPLVEDDGSYPLWWIVNYGVVGREYTVSDDLTAVYVDINDGLYVKDQNHWLTPDEVYLGEIDYMKKSGLMKDQYDQSNWVVLTNVKVNKNVIENENINELNDIKGKIIGGNTITGTLLDKKNSVIEVSDDAELEIGNESHYEPNIYIPASFMGRTQCGYNNKTYAFVQPKPQELIHIEWTIYNMDDGCFYLPEPDEDNDINSMGLIGGIKMSLDLYDGDNNPPDMVDYGIYDFDAINKLIVNSSVNSRFLKEEEGLSYTPYTDGGVSDTFIVYPLELPDKAPTTGITDVNIASMRADNRWYTIDGRNLGTTKPTTPGLYINCHRKVVIR